jgi:uncharacterized cupin superfamily protein
MEPRPGMFVARADTEAWEADPEVPGSSMHEPFDGGGLQAGFTRFDRPQEPATWTPDRREIAVVLEGSVRIEFEDGGDVTLGVGDSFTIPAGMTTTWHLTTPYRELWVLAEG